MGDLVASRTLNELYIYLDIAFLVILGAFLWITKRRVAFWFGIAGGLLYFAVDYGIFYLALHTRTVTGANTELWFYQLRVDLADAQSGQAPGRMVGTDCLRLDLFCDDEQ